VVVCGEGIERFLRLPFYCNEPYNLSLEHAFVKRISWCRVCWAQTMSTAVVTTRIPHVSANGVGVFAIQLFKVP